MRRGAASALVTMMIAVSTTQQSSAVTCGLNITDMSFVAEADTLSGSPIDTTATLQYNCSGGTPSAPLLICAGLGDGSVAPSGATRRMISGGDSHILYQLYENPGRTSI